MEVLHLEGALMEHFLEGSALDILFEEILTSIRLRIAFIFGV